MLLMPNFEVIVLIMLRFPSAVAMNFCDHACMHVSISCFVENATTIVSVCNQKSKNSNHSRQFIAVGSAHYKY